MAFSGALTLTDLNDYLGPSQACIKPVEGPDAPSSSALPDAQSESLDPVAAASTQIAIDHDGSYYESSTSASASGSGSASKPRQRTKLEAAQISLNDCLACSGCVTSAESVLITMQSQEEIKRALAELADSPHPTLRVASISTQSLASLSAKYTLQHQQSGTEQPPPPAKALSFPVLLHRVAYFLKTVFGFDHVYDTTFARHVALREHQAEFFERRNKRDRLPMLASACPGWICYAEKTHGELLPYISTTKSPQQVAGVVAKHFLPERLGLIPRQVKVYHVTVMPCYDKKLEASRPDFYDDLTKSKEVDCVLTTGELDKLMTDEAFDITQPVPGETEALLQAESTARLSNSDDALPQLPQLLDHAGSSSGGYLFTLMRAVWLDWVATHWDTLDERVKQSGVLPKLDVRVIRTADFTEYVLRAPGQNDILFRGAQCYGFRNLQNLVRKVQKQVGVRNARGAAGRLVDADANAIAGAGAGVRGRVRARGRGGMVRRARGGAASKSSPLNPNLDSDAVSTDQVGAAALQDQEAEEDRGYDYVEVMACPGGCVNGGGQIRPPTQSDTISNRSTTANADPEGYTQGGWAADQTATATATAGAGVDDLQGMLNNKHCSKILPHDDEDGDEDGEPEKAIQGWQGTSKEWVRRVEQAYWQGSRVAHPPVSVLSVPNSSSRSQTHSGASTPTLVGSGANTPLSSANAKSVRIEDHQRLLEALAVSQETTGENAGLAYADVMAELAVNELSMLAARARANANAGAGGVADEIALKEAREKLFRTQYRAVQDEAVNGLAVQW